MSYCRFSSGDVYMFHHCDGFISCCACSFVGGMFSRTEPDPGFLARTDAIEHLQKHINNHEIVPEYAIERLKEELKEVGDFIYDKDPPREEGLLCILGKKEIKGDGNGKKQ